METQEVGILREDDRPVVGGPGQGLFI